MYMYAVKDKLVLILAKKEKKAPAKETKAKSEAKSSAAATKKPTKNAAAKVKFIRSQQIPDF